MAAIAAPSSPASAPKSYSTRAVLGSILVVLVHGFNLLFWFFLMPHIEDMINSMGTRPPSTYSLVINVEHFLNGYLYFSLPVLIVLVALHGWAMWQPNPRRPMAFWLVLGMGLLLALAVFSLAFQIGSGPTLLLIKPDAGAH